MSQPKRREGCRHDWVLVYHRDLHGIREQQYRCRECGETHWRTTEAPMLGDRGREREL